MIAVRNLSHIALLAFAFLADMAAAKPGTSRPMVGLESGEGVTFTSEPDGSALSILYDQARAEIRASDPATVPSKTLERRFRIVLGRSAQTLQFQLRGFRTEGDDRTKLSLVIGARTIDLSPVLSSGTNCAVTRVRVNGGILDVIWTAVANHTVDEDTMIELDSIDILAVKPGTAASAPQACT